MSTAVAQFTMPFPHRAFWIDAEGMRREGSLEHSMLALKISNVQIRDAGNNPVWVSQDTRNKHHLPTEEEVMEYIATIEVNYDPIGDRVQKARALKHPAIVQLTEVGERNRPKIEGGQHIAREVEQGVTDVFYVASLPYDIATEHARAERMKSGRAKKSDVLYLPGYRPTFSVFRWKEGEKIRQRKLIRKRKESIRLWSLRQVVAEARSPQLRPFGRNVRVSLYWPPTKGDEAVQPTHLLYYVAPTLDKRGGEEIRVVRQGRLFLMEVGVVDLAEYSYLFLVQHVLPKLLEFYPAVVNKPGRREEQKATTDEVKTSLGDALRAAGADKAPAANGSTDPLAAIPEATAPDGAPAAAPADDGIPELEDEGEGDVEIEIKAPALGAIKASDEEGAAS